MTWRSRLLAAGVSLVLLQPGMPSRAQDSSKAETIKLLTDQLGGAEYMMGFVSNLYVASLRCGIGDPQIWVRVAAAVDRRIEHCARENPEWSPVVTRASEDAERNAPVRGQGIGYASLAFWKRVSDAERWFDKIAPSERCSSPALRKVLDPAAVPDEDLAKARQTMDPRVRIEFEMYEKWRTIADIQKWIATPCDALWPN